MGNCSNMNKTLGCVRQENFETLPSKVMKCPNKHWFAMFKTPDCSICSVGTKRVPADISCTVCAYSMCSDCYNNKLLKWKKRTAKLKPQVVSQALTQIKSEIDLSIEDKSNINLSKIYNRFVRYYNNDSLKNKQLGQVQTDSNLKKILTLQILKVSQMCEKVYKISTASAASTASTHQI